MPSSLCRGRADLSAEEELTLARQWRERQDVLAAHRVVGAHLRLVAKIAKHYRCYGLPFDELISEGNLGIMQAIQRFDPDRGFRFATYAVWWIRAAIQDHILRSRSLVRMGKTTAQKKLFYNLGRIKKEIAADNENDLEPEQVAKIADMLDVSEDDVVSMNNRLAGSDQTLNAPVRGDSAGEWQDRLADDCDSPETVNADSQELAYRRILLSEALSIRKDRERRILSEHHLKDNPSSFRQLAQQYGISQERVRYIDGRAFAKLQKAILAKSATARTLATDAAARGFSPRAASNRAAARSR